MLHGSGKVTGPDHRRFTLLKINRSKIPAAMIKSTGTNGAHTQLASWLTEVFTGRFKLLKPWHINLCQGNVFISAQLQGSAQERLFIVDTGSSYNILPLHLKDSLTLGKLKTAETGIKLKGVTGAELKVVGVIALDIKVNKLQVNCEFVVVDSKMDYPILGISFISGNRLIIDYDSNQIYDKTGRFHSNLTSASAVNKVSELKEEEEQLTGQARVDEIIRLLDLSNSTLKPDQIKRVESLITEYNHVFALYRSEVSFTNLVEHTIPLTSEEIVRCKYRPVPIHAIDDCIKEIDVLLRRGVIEKSESEYSSPVVIVKRNDKFRICVDYRSLNKISGASRAAVPALNTLTATFHGTKVFFSLDCREAFYQVKIKEEHRHRTAWTIPSIGHFQQVSMSLGLRGAPATMQSLLDKTIEGMRESVVGYVDDLAGGAEDNEKLILILEELFKRLSIANLRLHPAKCRLFASQISFLGVILDIGWVSCCARATPPNQLKLLLLSTQGNLQ